MKRFICFIFLFTLIPPAFGAEMSAQEIFKKVEEAQSRIEDMKFSTMLGYRLKGEEIRAMKVTMKSTNWYKKPGLVKSVTKIEFPVQPKQEYIFKLEGDQYCATAVKTRKNVIVGKSETACYPAEKWHDFGRTPAFIFLMLKKRMDDHTPVSVEYNDIRHIYTLTFAAPDEATFEISELYWLPIKLTVLDPTENKLTTLIWYDFSINIGLPDEMFNI